MLKTLDTSYALTLTLAVVEAGFLLRLFAIQHDCSHRSFVLSRKANDWLGRFLCIATFTPFDYWRMNHSVHHATSGNLDRRGVGDILTLTVREYRALGFMHRLRYRLYRHPAILFPVGSLYLFLVEYRFPRGQLRDRRTAWLSTQLSNIGILSAWAGLSHVVGFQVMIKIQLPVLVIAGTVGVWMFYVQHQFESTYWAADDRWNFFAGALIGSSHLELPRLVNWFTGNIAVHNLHHLNSRIPNYRLSEALSENPGLTVRRLGLREALKSVRLALWDEDSRRLVSFRDA